MDIWFNDSIDERETDQPVCPICHGDKVIHPLLESGMPDYHRFVPCKCAEKEIEKDRFNRLQKYSNLGTLSRLTFDKLLPEGRKYKGNNLYDFKTAYDEALQFAKSPRGWLIISGPIGSGKTHLSCAIANYRIEQNEPVFYIEAADLLDHLRATYYPESEINYDALFNQIRNSPLIVIDNLNVFSMTPWAKEKLRQILNYRFNEQLPSVITSETTAVELEKSLQCHLTDPEFCKTAVIKSRSDMQKENLDGLELELIKNMTFNNFDYKRMNLSIEDRQNLEQAYRSAYNFAQSPQGWLVLLGQNGCGKTHLAAAIANYLHENGKDVLFIIVPDFLDHLRSTFSSESSVSYDYLFERVKRNPVLILDDYGEQAVSPWTQEKLYQLINYRYNAKLPTVFTMSYSLDEIENRISSRMVDHTLSLVFTITAPDFRGDRKSAGRNTRQKYKKV